MKNRLYKIGLLAMFVSSIAWLGCSNENPSKAIGLQLYSLRDDIRSQGIEKIMAAVAEMGYTKVELAGYKNGQFYGYEPADFKALADKEGLQLTSSHVVRKMTKDRQADVDFWDKAIQAHAAMGVEYIIMPILPNPNSYPFKADQPITEEDVLATCQYFNQIGEMASAKGLKFGFHNHGHEHKIEVNGKSIYDMMLEKLDPKLVFMQMDVYWVKEGGDDPVKYLNEYAGRFPLFHIKDETAIGSSGETDFQPIFEAAYQQGMKEFFVEVEEYDKTPMEDVQQSFKYLNEADYVK